MKKLWIIIVALCAVNFSAFAEEADQAKEAVLERVGGEYTVSKIERQKDGSFLILFKSRVSTKVADEIILYSDHIHIGVKVGQTLRLSAEVNSVKKKRVEAAQVVVFLPKKEGPVPVWLLSKKGRKEGSKPSKYLKMHNPQSDFLVF